MTSLLLRFSKASRRTTVPPTILLPANARRRQRNGNAHSLKIQAISRATMQFLLLAKVNECRKSHFDRPLRNDNDGAEKTNEPRQAQTRQSARPQDCSFDKAPANPPTNDWMTFMRRQKTARRIAKMRICVPVRLAFPRPLPGVHYYQRDKNGEPTGWMVEGNAFWPLVPLFGIGSEEDFRAAYETRNPAPQSFGYGHHNRV